MECNIHTPVIASFLNVEGVTLYYSSWRHFRLSAPSILLVTVSSYSYKDSPLYPGALNDSFCNSGEFLLQNRGILFAIPSYSILQQAGFQLWVATRVRCTPYLNNRCEMLNIVSWETTRWPLSRLFWGIPQDSLCSQSIDSGHKERGLWSLLGWYKCRLWPFERELFPDYAAVWEDLLSDCTRRFVQYRLNNKMNCCFPLAQ